MKHKNNILLTLPVMAMLIFNGCENSGSQSSTWEEKSTVTSSTSQTETAETQTEMTTANPPETTTKIEINVDEELSYYADAKLSTKEAFDLVKSFIINDNKDYIQNSEPLYYEAYIDTVDESYHFIRERELKQNDTDTETGDYVTINWYRVNDETKEVSHVPLYDESGNPINESDKIDLEEWQKAFIDFFVDKYSASFTGGILIADYFEDKTAVFMDVNGDEIPEFILEGEYYYYSKGVIREVFDYSTSTHDVGLNVMNESDKLFTHDYPDETSDAVVFTYNKDTELYELTDKYVINSINEHNALIDELGVWLSGNGVPYNQTGFSEGTYHSKTFYLNRKLLHYDNPIYITNYLPYYHK